MNAGRNGAQLRQDSGNDSSSGSEGITDAMTLATGVQLTNWFDFAMYLALLHKR